MSDSERVPCPYCGEPILADAVKCRFCGEWLDERALGDEAGAKTLRVEAPRRGFTVGDGINLGCGAFIVLPLLLLFGGVFFLAFLGAC